MDKDHRTKKSGPFSKTDIVWPVKFFCKKCKEGVMMAVNNKECVNPLCARRLDEVSIQNEARKSISGILCAKAPHIIAFLPSFLPAKASPIQAPSAICVRESNV
jgi:hypothetical protein